VVPAVDGCACGTWCVLLGLLGSCDAFQHCIGCTGQYPERRSITSSRILRTCLTDRQEGGTVDTMQRCSASCGDTYASGYLREAQFAGTSRGHSKWLQPPLLCVSTRQQSCPYFHCGLLCRIGQSKVLPPNGAAALLNASRGLIWTIQAMRWPSPPESASMNNNSEVLLHAMSRMLK
jgi:hypothetical protein